eukprot:gb/GECG01000543.1/.p1 GENE.gb/GECG01000543.1/~~gb/GECG01000543.1/.p1  ORF type:complete len:987 (+),score=78.68 gb/GECG01000543.1/:1-2961(+)
MRSSRLTTSLARPFGRRHGGINSIAAAFRANTLTRQSNAAWFASQTKATQQMEAFAPKASENENSDTEKEFEAEDVPTTAVYTDNDLKASDVFLQRHLGTSGSSETAQMLDAAGGFTSFDQLIEATIPSNILNRECLSYRAAKSESEALERLRNIAKQNKKVKNLIGMGFSDTLTPQVIKRNMLENPSWYTAYTPYQAEISQGRLEMLLNFQTMVCDLTAMDISNASLLDESTAAAEGVNLAINSVKGKRRAIYVSDDVHPQTIDVVHTRCKDQGIDVTIGPAKDIPSKLAENPGKFAGTLVQYPNTYGQLNACDYDEIAEAVHSDSGLVISAVDLMSLTLLRPPSEWGADIAVGSAQRFGVPMGYGGPHAAFLATKSNFTRRIPGRVIGVSKDKHGAPALRMAMQTREQHIRRDKATSNICTAQALLANVAAAYAIYHGPEGLRQIASRTHAKTATLARMISAVNNDKLSAAPTQITSSNYPGNGLFRVASKPGEYFDTLKIDIVPDNPAKINADVVMDFAKRAGYNLRRIDDFSIGISVDECTTTEDLSNLAGIFRAVLRYGESRTAALAQKDDDAGSGSEFAIDYDSDLSDEEELSFDPRDWVHLATEISQRHQRPASSPYLTHEVFNRYHNETAMLRYLTTLASRDLTLAHSMIPLGSCTMKLNATSELDPMLWPEFTSMHPFAPREHAVGYREMMRELSDRLAEITGFAAVSFQPNSGAQGEYSGLRAIRSFLAARGEPHRNVCLIPASAHGTNPASAVMAGMKVVVVQNDPATGVMDEDDFNKKLHKHQDELGALMVTYPSTYGVFEDSIAEVVQRVHDAGGLVYMDGANMNAQCGLTSPGLIGADVCHLNLHKTFCIPHGGGGPGVGAIGVAAHLAPYLPGHSVTATGGHGHGTMKKNTDSIAATPYGSAMILPITWMYLEMLGSEGLRRATETAILNANYLAKRLSGHYKVAFSGKKRDRCPRIYRGFTALQTECAHY